MTDWKLAIIAFLLAFVVTSAIDAEPFERICNDPHIKCEDKYGK